MSFFARGVIIGFSIAAPVGPIGVLCIRRTLADGRLAGLICGLGAATADALYGCVAGFGLTAISSVLVGQLMWLRLIGGMFLCYLGARTFLAKPADQAAIVKDSRWLAAFGSTLFLTLTNPMTILSFAAVFAGLGLGGQTGNHADAGLLVFGVFAGSACWWLLLSVGVGLFRTNLTANHLQWVNRLSGAIIVVFGLLALSGLAA